jgi:hypothetical protein
MQDAGQNKGSMLQPVFGRELVHVMELRNAAQQDNKAAGGSSPTPRPTQGVSHVQAGPSASAKHGMV